MVAHANDCVSPPHGLVSWWQGEGSAADFAGTNSGTVQGGVGYAAGEVGQAFTFDGTTGGITVPAAATLDVGTADGLTLECWIKPSNLANFQPLAEYCNGTALGVGWWISEPWFGGNGGPGDLFADLTDTGGNIHILVTPPGLLTTNNFQHVALTYDKATGVGNLYLNGAVVDSRTLGGFTPQTTYDLLLGFRPATAPSPARYGGLTDEMTLYNRALSTNEIQAIYAAGSAGKCSRPSGLAVFTLQLTTYRQNTNHDNGTNTVTAPPKVVPVNTADILSALAFDENLKGNWPSNSFPANTKLATKNNSFFVVNHTNVLLNVSDIMSLTSGDTDVTWGSHNDTSGLASPSQHTRRIVRIDFDDTSIPGGKNLKFYLQGMLNKTRSDTTPVAGKYTETISARITSGAGEGSSQTVPFVCIGTATATGTTVLSP
jgi:hypothetical protein